MTPIRPADAPATPAPDVTAAGRPDLRKVRGARTRARILDAAQAEFADRGIGPVALRDIAARAGITHPGLLRHYPSKDALLDGVIDRIEQDNLRMLDARPLDHDALVALARHNAANADYVELFTRVAGEATSPDHPAHERIRARYGRLVDRATVHDAGGGAEATPLPPRAEAMRLTAVWDGLQLLSLYLPDRVDVPELLSRHLACLDRAAPPAPGAVPAPRPRLERAGVDDDGRGNAAGRERRARIVAEATARFARGGFHNTSLREVAADAGIGKSTLLHHFRSKDELLRTVLDERDRDRLEHDGPLPHGARAALAGLPAGARRERADAPGLIALYTVLAAEAAAPGHPAHERFARRFRTAIDVFADALDRAADDDGRRIDAEFEAIRLTALWDGLQIQWGYDHDGVDVPALLDAHLAIVLGDPAADA